MKGTTSLVAALLIAIPAAGLCQETPPLGYVVQTSDVVIIKYRYTPEYDFTGPVLPDGFISPSILGPVKIAGLTLEEARALLLKKASERLREPELTVDLREYEKPFFVVGGEVGSPGKFDLRGRVSLMEAVAIAGGYKPYAQRKQLILYRRFDRERAVARLIKTDDLMKPETEVSNLALQTGDFIMVPQNAWATIDHLIPLANLAFFNPLWWR
jgi:polysaccharide export outer membrane protein